MENKYKVVGGTSYDPRTKDSLINILEYCRINKKRIVLEYGDTKTNESWNETFNITGYIGRSTGINKIPILIYNKRSFGGGAILDHCIISIRTSKGKVLLWKNII